MEKVIKHLQKSKIQRLSDIIRYNTRAKNSEENVAEHSFYVAIEALKICNKLNIDDETKLKVLEYSVTHDIPEALSTDVPYDIKRDYPALSDMLQNIELTELSKHIPELKQTYESYVEAEHKKSLPYLIVKLADTISVLQYSYKEIQLGNETEEMNEIYVDCIDRILSYIKQVENVTGVTLSYD